MRNGIWLLIIAYTCSAWLTAGCSQTSPSSNTTTTNSCAAAPAATALCDGPSVAGWTSPSTSGSNQLDVSVSATTVCSSNVNLPCTSVTVCVPGTSDCQTISDILVDTGSYGLRIFSQAIPQNLCNSLSVETDGSGNDITECAQFGSANDWGPIVTADVQLGGETQVSVPMQIIHRTYGTSSAPCSCAENSPSDAGINGIIGVGLFQQDCGSGCVTSANVGIYFACNGSTCNGTTLSLANQVQNPVMLLASDNNGVILDFGNVGDTGGTDLTGTLTLGVDTQANNASSGATEYKANGLGYFKTTFNSSNYTQSFIDSGSNIYIFPDSSISQCSDYQGFYCPSSTQSLSATMIGSGGVGSNTVSFSIANTDNLLNNTSNNIFNNLGGVAPAGFGDSFDWGFPFFLGHKIYVVPSGASSDLGAGPYWAY